MNAFARLEFFLAAACGGLCAAGLSAQPASGPVAREPAVQLPTYTVAESRALPPPEKWSYTRIEGFEVLSSASERATRTLVHDFQRFHQALDIVWPGVDKPAAVSSALIVCGRGGEFDAFRSGGEAQPDRAAVSVTLRGREFSAIVIDQEAKAINLATPEGLAAGAVPAGDDSAAVAGGAGEFEVDTNRQLYREYLHFLLGGVEPRLPAWFEEGLAQIFMAMEIGKTSIVVGKVENPNTISSQQAAMKAAGISGSAPAQDRDFNAALAHRALLPMAQLFAVARDSDEARNPLGSTWAKQSYAFVHWGLYGDGGRHQRAFVTFVTRLAREAPTEALFKECFRTGYSEMGATLRSYVESTRYKSIEFRGRNGQTVPEPPAFELREATQSEVGRLKGDALRLAGREEAAHLALIAPYIRGERDPQLLAALGLQERAAGDKARARKFLEAAAQAKAVRPLAYLELARLRLTEAQAKPAGGPGKLGAEQMAAVLGPLFTARAQPPPLPEVYETIAEAWGRSAVAPSPGHLGVLDEGVRLFPRDAALVYQNAALKAKIGLSTEAETLIDLGLRIAPDAAMRGKFEALRARLAPPPVAPPPAPPSAK